VKMGKVNSRIYTMYLSQFLGIMCCTNVMKGTKKKGMASDVSHCEGAIV